MDVEEWVVERVEAGDSFREIRDKLEKEGWSRDQISELLRGMPARRQQEPKKETRHAKRNTVGTPEPGTDRTPTSYLRYAAVFVAALIAGFLLTYIVSTVL